MYLLNKAHCITKRALLQYEQSSMQNQEKELEKHLNEASLNQLPPF